MFPPALTLPVIDATEPRFKMPAIDMLPTVALPVAVIDPAVRKLPPVTLPAALTAPPVAMLPTVALPVADMLPAVLRFPPVTLPATDNETKVPTLVMAGCAALLTLAAVLANAIGAAKFASS
jgi:hypothetical protein